MLAIHEALAIALFATCFCRAVKTDRSVRKDVLAAFWLLGVVACIAIFAPMAFGWKPDLMSIALLAGTVIVQLVTGAHWKHGVPKEFIHDRT